MNYKGYRIVASDIQSHFYSIDEDGMTIERLFDIQYFDPKENDVWYSVVDKENWVAQTFDTIEECKEYIDEEVK